MTCVLDEASDIETRERESVLADRGRQASLQEQAAAARAHLPAICVACEDPIPQARRLAVPGCLRCAMCERLRAQRTHAR